jgi:hypothetical protein
MVKWNCNGGGSRQIWRGEECSLGTDRGCNSDDVSGFVVVWHQLSRSGAVPFGFF